MSNLLIIITYYFIYYYFFKYILSLFSFKFKGGNFPKNPEKMEVFCLKTFCAEIIVDSVVIFCISVPEDLKN